MKQREILSNNMKPSGIEWIGDIPSDWKVTKIKYLSTLKGRIGWQGLTSDEYNDEGAYLITGTDFDNGSIQWDTCVHVSMKRWAEAKDIQVKNGDLLITKDGTVGKVAIIKGLNGYASLNSGVLLISTFAGFDRKFLYWVLLSDVFLTWFSNKNAGNSTIIHLYQNDFAEFKYAIPVITEQRAIAAFLDTQCSKIDNIIIELEQQIGILRQYKTSLITETVTKGLNKNVPMKNSGIDWVEKIPAHWEVTRLRFLCKLKTGTTPPENEGITTEKTDCCWYTPGDFQDLVTLEQSEKYIDRKTINKNSITIFPVNSILLIAIGATLGKIGYINKESYSNQQITAIIPKHVDNKYLLYYLVSQTKYIKENALYTTLPIINNSYLSNIQICIPAVYEQRTIAAFLDTKCKEISDIIEAKQQSIETMKAYKKSLIYEYVTGKKRVKGYS